MPILHSDHSRRNEPMEIHARKSAYFFLRLRFAGFAAPPCRRFSRRIFSLSAAERSLCSAQNQPHFGPPPRSPQPGTGQRIVRRLPPARATGPAGAARPAPATIRVTSAAMFCRTACAISAAARATISLRLRSRRWSLRGRGIGADCHGRGVPLNRCVQLSMTASPLSTRRGRLDVVG